MGSTRHDGQIVLLAALLHDIGKISQREGGAYHAKHAEFSVNFISSMATFFGEENARKIASLIENHHSFPTTRDELIIHIADKLAAAERFKEPRQRFKSNKAALVALTSRITLTKGFDQEKYYVGKPLHVERADFFPHSETKTCEGTYTAVWNRFMDKVNRLDKYSPSDFHTLYFILKEIGSFIPSATPWEADEYNRTVPDVSLFDHSKITCALAACLNSFTEQEFSDEEMRILVRALRDHYLASATSEGNSVPVLPEVTQKALFLLIRADVAGIQKFIYGITNVRGETKGTSKRLRGRSFYVSLLTDVISDYIIREMKLPITNILFCGGGRFDLILPNNKEVSERLGELMEEIDDWLMKEFYGELSIPMAVVTITPNDFSQFDRVYRRAESALLEVKTRQYKRFVSSANFFNPQLNVSNWCKCCSVVPIEHDGPCDQCALHHRIGAILPKKDFISFVYGVHDENSKNLLSFPKFNTSVLLQDEYELKEFLAKQRWPEARIYRINPKYTEATGLEFLTNNGKKGTVSYGFKFIGNSAPIALMDSKLLPSANEPTKRGEVLEFEEIAELSTGAKYLGILRMDVDYLGPIFGIGIDQPSMSRVATLSSNIELFFNAWLSSLCEKVSDRWNASLLENDDRKNFVKNVFYIVYSGGDDLFVVGPWDQVIELAQQVCTDFQAYTCNNPNITLSGGILLAKPHFPVHRFAPLAGQELGISKNKGRNRVTLFNETVEWEDGPKCLQNLIGFGKEMAAEIRRDEKPLSKGFVQFLRTLEKQFKLGTDEEDINWIPQFLYSVARRVDRKVEERLGLINQIPRIRGKIKIPVTYASLITRKEG